jgi:hypothetical protein
MAGWRSVFGLPFVVLKLRPCLGHIQVGLIQAASFKVGGSYLALQHPLLYLFRFVSLKLAQSSLLLVSVLGSVFQFHQVSTSHQISATYVIMVDIEELSQDSRSAGALAYLVECAFPKDQDTLLSFFDCNGIEDFKDFMSFHVVAFNQPWCALENPNTLLSLSSSLIKKLLSVQSWYGYRLQDETNDSVKVVYSLTVNMPESNDTML